MTEAAKVWQQHADSLALSGANLIIGLRGRVRIYCEAVRRLGPSVFEVAPWGLRRTMEIDLADVTTVTAAEVTSYDELQKICARQRAELEGKRASDV